MMAFIKSRRGAVVTLLTVAALSLVFTTARAQGNRDSSNGVPQQIAELRAQLAQTQAALQRLQAALDEERTAREADTDRVENVLQRLPDYLLDRSDRKPPDEIGDRVEQ